MANAARFRDGMTAAGFTIKAGIHPIVPIMLGDARARAATSPTALLDEGIYVIGFSLPRRPEGRGAHPRAALAPPTSPSTSIARSRRSPRSASASA